MTTISDWVLNIIIGTGFAVYTGAQGGMEGDLPFSDLLLPFRARFFPPTQLSGDNVVIGFDSLWARMVLKKLDSKRLSSCYMLLNKFTTAKCGCYKVRGPHFDILPNMFYGLVSDDENFKVVHRSNCIDSLGIDIRATEYTPIALKSKLDGATNHEAWVLCRSIVKKMEEEMAASENATIWDKDMAKRIDELMNNIEISEPEVKIVEALDRIHKRLCETMTNLGLVSITVGDASYTVDDVRYACILCLSIQRGKAMSDYIYNANGLVLMGYNIAVAREFIQDASHAAAIAEEPDHYSTRMKLDTTTYPRLVDIPVKDGYIFLGLLLDGFFTTFLALFTRIDIILCMVISRVLTGSYRGRRGQLSTSLSWSISRVMLRYTGLARDDWMACIIPAHRVNRWITLYVALSLFASLSPFCILYKLSRLTNPYELPWDGAMPTLIVGTLWIIAVFSMHQLKLQHVATSIAFFVFLFVATGIDSKWNPVPQSLPTIIFLLQWLLGELLRNGWIHRSASFFAFGSLGAARCFSSASHDF